MPIILCAILWIVLQADCATAAQNKDTPKKPNILFILTEDQGAHMSLLGTPALQTPHMDKLAKEGAFFKRAYVNYPVCSASKACIMTGLYSHNNGLINNTNNFFKPASQLSQSEKNAIPYKFARVKSAGKTMVEVLKEAHYFTAITGKIHLSPNERFPYDMFISRNTKTKASPLLQVVNKAKSRAQPWFLFHNAITSTHRPFRNSDKTKIMVDPQKVMLPEFLPDTPACRKDWAEYLDGVQLADKQLGQLLATLRKTADAENTIIIFMGDHGPCYQHGKMSPYSLGMHVPLVIKMPGIKSAVVNEVVSEIDILPTLLDYLGLSYHSKLQGRSLLTLITSEQQELSHRDFIFSEVSGKVNKQTKGMEERSVNSQNFHLIVRSHIDEKRQVNADLVEWKPWRNRVYADILKQKDKYPLQYRILTEMDHLKLSGNPPPLEFYDLNIDPDEMHNLIDNPAYRTEIQSHYTALKLWMKETNDHMMELPPLK